MNIAIDIVLVAIAAYCAWRGFKNGIIRGVCGILAIIIALYGANLVASVYSSEFTGMLKPFVGGIVDSSVSAVLSTDEEKTEAQPSGTAASPSPSPGASSDGGGLLGGREVMKLTDKEKTDVYTVCFASLRYLGLAESSAGGIATDVSKETTKVGQEMSAGLTAKLCSVLAFVAVFAICFILIAIVFSVIGTLIDLTFSIPGIERVEPYIGAVLGLVRGFAVILIIAIVFRYAGILISEETIEKTVLLELLIEWNPIAGLLGL